MSKSISSYDEDNHVTTLNRTINDPLLSLLCYDNIDGGDVDVDDALVLQFLTGDGRGRDRDVARCAIGPRGSSPDFRRTPAIDGIRVGVRRGDPWHAGQGGDLYNDVAGKSVV